MEIRYTRSSTRHRISRKRSSVRRRDHERDLPRERSKGIPAHRPASGLPGPDEQGELLEVMAIETDTGGLLIIHAQQIRKRYLELLKGGSDV